MWRVLPGGEMGSGLAALGVSYWLWGALIGTLIAVVIGGARPWTGRGASRSRLLQGNLFVWGVVMLRDALRIFAGSLGAGLPGGGLVLWLLVVLGVFCLLRVGRRPLGRIGPRLPGLPWLAGASLLVLASLWLPALRTSGAGAGFERDRVEGVAPPNLLLISLDTVRADALGCYGNSLAYTPNLDGLASEGVRFSNAFTPMPLTRPAHATMLTGMDPIRHGALDNWSSLLPDDAVLLSEWLADEGYDTAAFISAHVISKRWGMAQGFRHYDDGFHRLVDRLRFMPIKPADLIMLRLSLTMARVVGLDTFVATRDGSDTVERAQAWLNTRSDAPFFAFVHLYDAHWPFRPPPEYAKRFRLDGDPSGSELDEIPETPEYADLWRRLYAAEVSYSDELVGGLLRSLDEEGILDRTLVIVVSDHGESFGQDYGHGDLVFERVLQVAMLARLPSKIVPGTVVEANLALADLMPTALHWMGLEAPGDLDGRTVDGDRSGRGELFATSGFHESLAWRPKYLSYRDGVGNWMYEVETGHLELEGEGREDGASRGDADARGRAEARLEAYWDELQAAAGRSVRTNVDETTKQALRALGYLE